MRILHSRQFLKWSLVFGSMISCGPLPLRPAPAAQPGSKDEPETLFAMGKMSPGLRDRILDVVR
jgi:hypothetical protein